MARQIPLPPNYDLDERILNYSKHELISTRAAIVILLVAFCIMWGALIVARQKTPQTVYVTNTVEVIQWRTNLLEPSMLHTHTNIVVEGRVTIPNHYTPENGYATTNVEVKEWFSGMSSNDMAILRDLSPEALEAYWNSLTPQQKLDAR